MTNNTIDESKIEAGYGMVVGSKNEVFFAKTNVYHEPSSVLECVSEKDGITEIFGSIIFARESQVDALMLVLKMVKDYLHQKETSKDE